MPPMSPNLAVMMARMRANQTQPVYATGSPLDVTARTFREAPGVIADAAGSVADTVHSANRSLGAMPASAWRYMTSAPGPEVPTEYSAPAGTRVLDPATAAAMRAAHMRSQPAPEPLSQPGVTDPSAAQPAPSAETGESQLPPTFIRYKAGPGGWKHYAGEGTAPNVGRGVATPALIAGSFNGGDMPRWPGRTLRSGAQMEQDINARNLLDEAYAPPDETPIMMARARQRAALATEEAKAKAAMEDPSGINAYVAKKLADLQIARHNPEEQRRAQADSRRAEVQSAFQELQETLASGPYTEEQKRESIRKFMVENAMAEAQRSGDFGPLTRLLGDARKEDEEDALLRPKPLGG